ncbi:hypothetical protein Syun_006976 [Stephania yunnanensis]|uniref:Peptidase A1 domain-containing protein n=1 Tax=Stephania yunnanensis TaxID=152371 RepID=A0AAP0L083_9MAGN
MGDIITCIPRKSEGYYEEENARRGSGEIIEKVLVLSFLTKWDLDDFFFSPPHLFFRFLFPLHVSLSSSFSSISCDTPQSCDLDIFACRNNYCLYQVSYGDGSYTVGDGSYTVSDDSYTVGDCISETLTFNDVASVDNIAHGCGDNIEGLFVGAAGFYKGVTTSQLDELAAETAAAMTASHPDYASVNVLVLSQIFTRTRTFYYVELAGVEVGGEVIPVAEAAVGSGGGGVIVDLGTAVTSGDDGVRGGEGQVSGGARGCRRPEGWRRSTRVTI